MDWVLVWPWVDGLGTHEALGRNLVPRRKLAVAIKNKVTFCRSEQSYLEKGKKNLTFLYCFTPQCKLSLLVKEIFCTVSGDDSFSTFCC